jgi:TRAP-type C4-dicarboxylate transport system substrate-binding protein
MGLKKIAAAAALAPALTLAGTALAAQKWDMPLAYPAGNFHSVNAAAFGQCVKEATQGEIDIVTHPGGSLFKGNDIKRAVQTGQTPIGERLLSAHENENPLFGMDSIPFLTDSYEQSEKLWRSGRAELQKALEKQGIVLLYSVPWPPQGFYFKKSVEGAADMAGVRVRSYNNATGRIAELSGMAPVQLEAAEITQGLITGVIESLITSAVTGQDSKAWEQLSHFYKVNAWQPRNYVIANKDVWSGLDTKTQDKIKSCAATAEANGTKLSKEANEKALAELEKHGMKVQKPSDRLTAELRNFGATMTGEWKAKAGETGQAILDSYAN